MARIVAGVFDDQRSADGAVDSLRALGFSDEDFDSFVLNPPGRHNALPLGGDEDADAQARGSDHSALKGAAVGSAIGVVAGALATPIVGPVGLVGGLAAGAYAGSLAGALNGMGDGRKDADGAPVQSLRPFGVLLAVNTEIAADEDRVLDTLYDHGARMIERAQGEWRDGHWIDFDPVAPPQAIEFEAKGT